jgi:hypothetical protein
MNDKQHNETEPVDIEHILETLRRTLLDAARGLVHQDPLFSKLSEEEQERELCYMADPDSSAGHSPRWHQYGILTHSEEFRKFIETEAPKLTREWGIVDVADAAQSQEIDGVSKADLLQVVSLLHDMGKFTARKLELQEDSTTLARFDRHEEHSRDIIQGDLKEMLLNLDLSEAQIEYIATCAEYHFELGKARKAAIEEDGKNNYTIEFAKSDEFKSVAQDIIDAHPDFALEIGLMFMADSFSKTEVAAKADTDEEIAMQKEKLEQEIKDKSLSPRLINQALQQPVNVEIGKQYLLIWASAQR